MLRTMLEARAPLYGEVATATVTTAGREPAAVIAEVSGLLHAAGGAR
jgi:shikimate kinase